MKSINEYMIENEIYEDIFQRLYFHTCVEFKLDHNLHFIFFMKLIYNIDKFIGYITI